MGLWLLISSDYHDLTALICTARRGTDNGQWTTTSDEGLEIGQPRWGMAKALWQKHSGCGFRGQENCRRFMMGWCGMKGWGGERQVVDEEAEDDWFRSVPAPVPAA